MRRLALVLAAVTALPLLPAEAGAGSTVTTWVAERTSSTARTVLVRGGAGTGDHDYAMAAVAGATIGSDGRFTGAEGGLFFGATAESDSGIKTPVGETRCSDLPNPGGSVCFQWSGAAIGFAILWEDVPFNRVFVVLRGRDAVVDLGEDGTEGWRLRRWYGPVRISGDGDDAAADVALGVGAGTFSQAGAIGGPGGSVAIGHPPCRSVGYTGLGSGVVGLYGGEQDVVATCAGMAPPASAAAGSTEWTFSGAAAGMSDVPARLVVIEQPSP